MILLRNQKLDKIKHNQSGIALVLTVLILTNLLVLTFVVTDVILRVGKTSQQIGESEIAYFAAETAIEKAIYEIENNQNASDLGTFDFPQASSLVTLEGSAETYIEAVNSLTVTCIDDQNKMSFPGDPATATDKSCVYAEDLSQNQLEKSNPLKIRLKPGKSFEINFNISTPPSLDFYPTAVTLGWETTLPGKVIILTEEGQSVVNTNTSTTAGRVPTSGQMGDSPNYAIRILNNGASDMTYTIAPLNASVPLSVGILVTSKGYYDIDKKERIIVVERRNWEIY